MTDFRDSEVVIHNLLSASQVQFASASQVPLTQSVTNYTWNAAPIDGTSAEVSKLLTALEAAGVFTLVE